MISEKLLIDHGETIFPKMEYFDNRSQEFITIEEKRLGPVHLLLAHSLVSVAKWESRWCVPFVGKEQLTENEFIDYVRCMTVNEPKDPNMYDYLIQKDVDKIAAYMQAPFSAWEIRTAQKESKRRKKRPETVEAIYYAMIQLGIPMECEKWHLNRLIALIDYCGYQGGSMPGGGGGSPAKRSQKEIMELYRAMNEKNRKRFNSKG